MMRSMDAAAQGVDEMERLLASSGLVRRIFINRRRKREGRPPIRGWG